MNPFFTTCLTVAFINAIGLISPGPDFVVVTKHALQSRKAGIYTALGITFGLTVHLFMVFFLLDTIQDSYPHLLKLISYTGAGYLIYLAVRIFYDLYKADLDSEVSSAPNGSKKMTKSKFHYFTKGFFTNVFNVKAYFFFISVLAGLLKGNSNQSGLLMVTLSSIILISCFAWFSSLSVLISSHRFCSFLEMHRKKIDFALAGTLVIFAANILASV